MLLTKIWERYFIKEFLKTLFFFLTIFYALFALIDYSSHTSSFHHHNVKFQWHVVAIYYGCELVRRLEVLLPFALLISTIKTLCSLNAHHELVALMSSGISLRTLMRPFLILGLAFTVFMYFNTEFFIPGALKELKHIDNSYSQAKHKDILPLAAQHIALEDGSTLIFQNYDSAQKRFFDVYWVRTINDIYRMKYLYPFPESSSQGPVGYYVDYITRNSDGELSSNTSYTKTSFPDIHFNQKTLFETITFPVELSLTQLWEKQPRSQVSIHEKESQMMTVFYNKLILPWLCLFAILAPAPFCLRFSRHLPVFLIYAGCIFGLVAVYLVIDAATILGKRQVLPPFWALWPLFIAMSGYFSWRFLRL